MIRVCHAVLLAGLLVAAAGCPSPHGETLPDGDPAFADAGGDRAGPGHQASSDSAAGGAGDLAGAPPADAGGKLDAAPNPDVADLDGGPPRLVPQDTAGPPPPDAAGPAPPDTMPSGPPMCRGPSDCDRGFNCRAGRCVSAPVSCRALKNDDPSAADGIYWINPTGVPLRAYCDMREVVELCTEVESEHRGRTRDPARLVFRMMSVLDAGAGVCRLWALRALSDGFPLEVFSKFDQAPQLDTCRLLGFVATEEVGRCAFGSQSSKCGFPIGEHMLWGNHCRGCAQNDGDHDHYVLQGPVFSGNVMTSVDGAVSTRCRVR
jgi:hypothetical protein